MSIARPVFTFPVWLNRLAPALVLVPLVCFVTLVLTYSANIPWFDDIDAFVTTLLHYQRANSFSKVLNELVRPNNEHRIFLGKLLMVSWFKLTGELNFRVLILLAFGFLLTIPTVLFALFRSMKLPVLVFLPTLLALLQPQYHLTSLWAVTGLQHEVSLALEVLVMYVLATQQRFGLGLGIQVLASVSMSNGLFGWVAGAGMLLLQRRWLALGGWLVMGVLTGWFYFHDAASTQGNETGMSFFLHNPHLVMAGFFTFLGGLFDFMPDTPIGSRSVLPTIAGLSLFSVMIWFLWRMNKHLLTLSLARPKPADDLAQRRFFFTGLYLLLLTNALVVAFLRVRFSYDVMLVGNYMIYPAVLVSLLYLNGLSEFQAKNQSVWLRRWAGAGLVVGGAVWLLSYSVNLPRLAARQAGLRSYAYNQQHVGYGLGGVIGMPFGERMRAELDTLTRQQTYTFPAFFQSANTLLKLTAPMPIDSTLRLTVRPYEDNYAVTVAGNGGLFSARDIWLVARSAEHVCLFPIKSSFQSGVFWFGRPRSAVEAEVIGSMMPPGSYRLGLLTMTKPATIRFGSQVIVQPVLSERLTIDAPKK